MAQVLLLNPRKRRAKKRHAGAKRRRNPMPAALKRYWATHRRGGRKAKRAARRRNPLFAARRHVAHRSVRRRHVRRHRNPIALRGIFGGVVPMLTNAAIGASGAIVMDLAYKQLNPMLPAAVQVNPMSVGLGDGVKVLATIALGRMLSRMTRGLSNRMAQGSLIVQTHGLFMRQFGAQMGLSYSVAAPTVPGSPRVGPTNFRAYVRPGSPTPMLNGIGAYAGGQSPLLNGRRSMRDRESLVR